MTHRRWKFTWFAAVLAVVFAGTSPADAGPRGKRDEALDKHLKLGRGDGEYRVIVETVDHARATGDEALKRAGVRKLRQLISFPGQVVAVTAQQLDKLEKSPLVKSIYLDRRTEGLADFTSLTTGAWPVRSFLRYTGKGVGIAVIDSGVAAWHDDLTVADGAGQRVAAFVDFVSGEIAPYDDYGHGTHVAGIIAGNGYDSPGVQSGIAPGAQVVALKVLDGTGAGFMSDVIAAIDWAVAYRTQYGIRIINLSVGAPVTGSYLQDPLALAAKRAVDSGIVVVAAAGNRGRSDAGQIQYGGITAPGNAPWVVTVGAANTQGTIERWDDTVAGFSSRGPTAVDYHAKPDLVAPGVGVVSLSAPGSALALKHAAALVGGTRATAQPPYLALSGTSMAAPVVAGTVALMLEANPSLTPNLVKAVLQYSAQSISATTALAQGAGFLNALGAVRLAKHLISVDSDAERPSMYGWSRQIVWGNHRLSGGTIRATSNAWGDNIVWGTASTPSGDNIVWGTTRVDGANIVWGTTADAAGDNIVWGTTASTEDNIVWGTDCGGADCDNIVWGTTAGVGDNIVWGTAETLDNIVWGTAGDVDNIVWGTSGQTDNIVWGTSAGADNIVWGTEENLDNIVWGTTTVAYNVVWGTSGEGYDIISGGASDDNIVWGTGGPGASADLLFQELVTPPPPPADSTATPTAPTSTTSPTDTTTAPTDPTSTTSSGSTTSTTDPTAAPSSTDTTTASTTTPDSSTSTTTDPTAAPTPTDPTAAPTPTDTTTAPADTTTTSSSSTTPTTTDPAASPAPAETTTAPPDSTTTPSTSTSTSDPTAAPTPTDTTTAPADSPTTSSTSTSTTTDPAATPAPTETTTAPADSTATPTAQTSTTTEPVPALPPPAPESGSTGGGGL